MIKENIFTFIKHKFLKRKEKIGFEFINLFHGRKIDDNLLKELEEQLLIADVNVNTTHKIITDLTKKINSKQLNNIELLYGLLQDRMRNILINVEKPLLVTNKKPFIILIVGVNGVGKTTTIGKLAYKLKQKGKSIILAAGDTFRAAAVEQLQILGKHSNIPVITKNSSRDSASVIFDAIKFAKMNDTEVVIIDTAGRLQNKLYLMEELKKIVRVIKKLDEGAPHEIMLIVDASTGQNTINQTKLFHEAIKLTGITITKFDGTAKGGVILSIADQFNIPIRYIGSGEHMEDLHQFNVDNFIEAFFAKDR